MKTYNVENGMTFEAKTAIESIINTHEKYKKAYFWQSAKNANARRARETAFFAKNEDCLFITNKEQIECVFTYSETCKNIYYSLDVKVNGIKKTISSLKKLLK